MAEFEQNKQSSDEWYTPKSIFDGLGVEFDLDPCHPGRDCAHCHVPAKNIYTKEDDGLSKPWEGRVFVNPPYGERYAHVPWLKRFLFHGNGIGVFRAYTSADWFHDYAVRAHAMLFPRGKTKFVRADGIVGKQPGHGVVLLGMGDRSCAAMRDSKLGLYVEF